MNTNKNLVYNQHRENEEWVSKLSFYKDEIAIMQNRIQEVVSANTSKEILSRAEHFQNQLIVQKNNIDMIKHGVNESERSLENNILHNPVSADHRKTEDHSKERKDVTSFENNFTDLRRELNTFLSKTL
jgi:hypothetical protein